MFGESDRNRRRDVWFGLKKKVRTRVVSELREEVKVRSSCRYFGISRSGFYASLNSGNSQSLSEAVVVELVQELRRQLPRIGGRKLYKMLEKDLEQAGKIGRDKFFDILRSHGLLVERSRSSTRTTNSYHRFHKYGNLLYDRQITAPNECWVSDITYIRTLSGFVYLFLITDYYSRKIVGWDLSGSLSIEGGLKALEMALRQRKSNSGLIHHSDRGIQYCCKSYVDLLVKHNVQISMTEQNHCYENAKAERMNGILKNEFLLNSTFNSFSVAKSAVREAIKTYNQLRPHWSLNLLTPEQVHAKAA